MDFSKLKRDPKLNFELLDETKSGQFIAKADCQAIFPSRYFDVGLGKLGTVVEALGVYALVSGDRYTISMAHSIVPFTPDSIGKFIQDEKEYTVLSFSKGSVFCPNINLVKSDTLLYYISEFFYRGANIPYFLDPDKDVATMFRDVEYYTGVRATYNNRPWELMASWITRNDANLREFWRHLDDVKNKKCVYVPLDSVAFSAVNTLSKITGAYLNDGLLSAALHKSTETSNIEEVIRS